MKLRHLPLLLPLLAWADGEHLLYTCDNGSKIEISFTTPADERPFATLHFADGNVILPMVPSASGSLYRAEPVSLHTKGDEAIFQDGKDNLRRCTKGAVTQSTPVPVPVPVPATSFMEISGNVSYRSRIALPPDAILTLRIRDAAHVGRSPRTLVEQAYELNGAPMPIPFSATLDRDLISKKARLVATAQIEYQGKVRFITARPYPLFKKGQALPLDIQLKPTR